jgi:hypothetical protein
MIYCVEEGDVKKCLDCDWENQDDATVCQYCGKLLGEKKISIGDLWEDHVRRAVINLLIISVIAVTVLIALFTPKIDMFTATLTPHDLFRRTQTPRSNLRGIATHRIIATQFAVTFEAGRITEDVTVKAPYPPPTTDIRQWINPEIWEWKFKRKTIFRIPYPPPPPVINPYAPPLQ